MPHISDDEKESLVIFLESKAALITICNGDYQADKSINIFLMQIKKPSILQWIPTHVGIGDDKWVYVLTKTARDLDPFSDQPSTIISDDSNIIVTTHKRKISISSVS
ncbi:hypothetical protein TNCV_1331211 [Trichonephila clavipes]|nr:hypothetical protein TNCV_1331211 [Trichonephila clavipes]